MGRRGLLRMVDGSDSLTLPDNCRVIKLPAMEKEYLVFKSGLAFALLCVFLILIFGVGLLGVLVGMRIVVLMAVLAPVLAISVWLCFKVDKVSISEKQWQDRWHRHRGRDG
jgi:hypothetical protein